MRQIGALTELFAGLVEQIGALMEQFAGLVELFGTLTELFRMLMEQFAGLKETQNFNPSSIDPFMSKGRMARS